MLPATLKVVFLVSLFGQSDAFYGRWQRGPNGICYKTPFSSFGTPDAGCPGGPSLTPPQPPVPDPKVVAQNWCTAQNPGSIAVFRADNTHHACLNPTCAAQGGWIPAKCR